MSVEDFNEAREARVDPDEPELGFDDDSGPDMEAIAKHIAEAEMA